MGRSYSQSNPSLSPERSTTIRTESLTTGDIKYPAYLDTIHESAEYTNTNSNSNQKTKRVQFNNKAEVVSYSNRIKPKKLLKYFEKAVDFSSIEIELKWFIITISIVLCLVQGMNQIVPIGYLLAILYQCYNTKSNNEIIIRDEEFCPFYLILIMCFGFGIGVLLLGSRVTYMLNNKLGNITPAIGYSILLTVCINIYTIIFIFIFKIVIVTTVGYGLNYYISSTYSYIFALIGICTVEGLEIIKWPHLIVVGSINILAIGLVCGITALLSLI